MTVKFKFFLQHVTGVHWQCQTVPVLPGPHPDRDCHSHGENQRDRLSGPAVGHRRTSVFTTHWPGLITDVHATQVATTTGSSATRILSPVFVRCHDSVKPVPWKKAFFFIACLRNADSTCSIRKHCRALSREESHQDFHKILQIILKQRLNGRTVTINFLEGKVSFFWLYVPSDQLNQVNVSQNM